LSYAPFSSKNSIRLFFTQIQSLYTFSLLLLPLLSVNQGFYCLFIDYQGSRKLIEAQDRLNSRLAIIFAKILLKSRY
jgi:hypothetical protein